VKALDRGIEHRPQAVASSMSRRAGCKEGGCRPDECCAANERALLYYRLGLYVSLCHLILDGFRKRPAARQKGKAAIDALGVAMYARSDHFVEAVGQD
jgi:hypothetical protein